MKRTPKSNPKPKRKSAAGSPRRSSRGRPPTTPARAARIGDEAVLKATGKSWGEWFDALDAAGATSMPHRDIARWLLAEHGMGPWWRQMVAVGYEQARGLRRPHEKPGGFEISRSKTVPVPLERLYAACSDPNARARWLPEGPLTVRTETPLQRIRIAWVDGATSVELSFASRGEGKSQIAIQHGKLPSARHAERMKGFWEQRLLALAALLGGGD